ncbi:hypothetical protein DL93DRAFT_2087695 [Clavulina sp. PMI_390]|nr:hypothetical protein DL93DRAFT_2087695 [Clavulina sp. PMI_390]
MTYTKMFHESVHLVLIKSIVILMWNQTIGLLVRALRNDINGRLTRSVKKYSQANAL